MTMFQLALISIVALIGALAAVNPRLRVPVVVGELALGVVMGAGGFRLLDATEPTFAFLGNEIGFALVMFVAGSHVPLHSPALRSGFAVGAARAVGVGILAVPAGLGLAALFGTRHGLLYAVLIASSSAAMILPSLGDTPLEAPPIVAMVAQVAIADTACIVLLPLTIDPSAALSKAFGVVVVLAASFAIFLFFRWAERSGRRHQLHRVSEDRGLALELRISLAILFVIVALAQWVGVSPMLAGFGVGLALAAVGEPRRLARQLFGLTEGFFAPIFFVWLGASLGLRSVLEHPQLLLLGASLGLAAAIVHGLLAVTRQPLPIAVTTCAQLGVPVAAATLGTTHGTLAPGEDAALLIGALVTIAITTAMNGRVARLANPAPEAGHDATAPAM